MDDAGILAAIPGQYVSEASHKLPPAESAAEDRMSAEVDTTAAWRGVVRITFQRTYMKHRKHSWWSWVAVHAEKT